MTKQEVLGAKFAYN